jgi:hypothetical protein
MERISEMDSELGVKGSAYTLQDLQPENNISYSMLKLFCEEICKFSWPTTCMKCLITIIIHLGTKYFNVYMSNLRG